MFRDGVARLLVFRLGAERFGIALSEVDEVVDAPVVQRVPDASPLVLGVLAHRGGHVTMFDPGPILNVEARLGGAALLFLRDGRRMALAIDDVYDAIVVEEGELRPASGMDASDGILLGVIRRGADLIAALDAGALLDAALAVDQGERS